MIPNKCNKRLTDYLKFLRSISGADTRVPSSFSVRLGSTVLTLTEHISLYHPDCSWVCLGTDEELFHVGARRLLVACKRRRRRSIACCFFSSISAAEHFPTAEDKTERDSFLHFREIKCDGVCYMWLDKHRNSNKKIWFQACLLAFIYCNLSNNSVPCSTSHFENVSPKICRSCGTELDWNCGFNACFKLVPIRRAHSVQIQPRFNIASTI